LMSSSTWLTQIILGHPKSLFPLNFNVTTFLSTPGAGAVSIATGYCLDGWGVRVRVPVGARFFSPHRPDWFWGPPSLLSNGYWVASSLEVKRPGREADHSPPTNAEVKNTWIYASTPPYVFMV
jgi:hypothetical protein